VSSIYKKISVVAYLNVFVVLIIGILHERIEAVSMSLLFIVLMVYAVLNGIYIQREMLKQKDLAESINSERVLSTTILESIPTAIVIVNPVGRIEYVNKAAGRIFGSMETVGENILGFDTVLKSGLHKNIRAAIEGNVSEMNEFNYTSFTSGVELLLNVSIKPFKYIEAIKKYEIMILFDDISEESRLKTKVENQYLHMFKSFAKFIDAKDAYTGQHSNNVSKSVEMILEFLPLSEEEKHDVRIASALHDIGKIGISESILNKPGKLTNEEYSQMKMHPVIGAELLAEIEDYKDISKIIRHHHERWDGNGYPDNLKGNQIPLGSQIIAISDTYDAITTSRVYRNARNHEDAVEIIKDERWKQFNGKLVDLFLSNVVRYIEYEPNIKQDIV